MSDLPRYTRTPNVDEAETEALVKKGRNSFDDHEETDPAPSYPPVAGGSSSSKRNVTYEYEPEYPRTGNRSRVLGILGRDKDETMRLVRKVFPELDEIPDERISFQVSFGESAEWSKLMDEVWPQFVDNPPTRMKVEVADGPGDASKRNRRDLMIMGIVLLLSVSFFVFIYAIVSSSNKNKH